MQEASGKVLPLVLPKVLGNLGGERKKFKVARPQNKDSSGSKRLAFAISCCHYEPWYKVHFDTKSLARKTTTGRFLPMVQLRRFGSAAAPSLAMRVNRRRPFSGACSAQTLVGQSRQLKMTTSGRLPWGLTMIRWN